jgi:hypothetical protein
MSSVSDWDNEYARLARAASQLRTPGLGSTPSDAQAFQTSCRRLQSSLASLKLYLTPAELQRRERLIQHLMTSTNTATSNVRALQQQDDMIDELGVGVSRLKNQTLLINDEAKLHTTLLGQMEENVEAAQVGLEGETRRAELVRENQSVWKLQLIVAGLTILLVLLILMGLSP